MLVVERYDRIIDDGPAHVFRLHQEDVCYRLTDLGKRRLRPVGQRKR